MKPRMVTFVLLALAQTGCRGCFRSSTAEDSVTAPAPPQASATAPGRSKPSETGNHGRVIDIEGAADYTCALTDLGEVYCWGTMDAYPCRSGCEMTWDSDGPQRVQPLPPVRQIEVSLIRAAAVAENGQVYARGLSVAPFYLPGEQLDPRFDVVESAVTEVRQEDTAPQARTTKVPLDTRLRTSGSIVFDDRALCLVHKNELVSCGVFEPRKRHLPRPPHTAPFEAPQRLQARLLAASASRYEGCIVLSDGTIRCTDMFLSVKAPPLREVSQDGLEIAGVAEDGSVIVWLPYADVLIHHRTRKPALVIDTNGVNTCFALSDGSVECALPEKETKTLAIHQGKEVTDVVDLVVGSGHLCVLDTRGQVRCWGEWPRPVRREIAGIHPRGSSARPDSVTSPPDGASAFSLLDMCEASTESPA